MANKLTVIKTKSLNPINNILPSSGTSWQTSIQVKDCAQLFPAVFWFGREKRDLPHLRSVADNIAG